MDTMEMIKDHLNKLKVKLWLPPYVEANGRVVTHELQKLSHDLVTTFSFSEDVIEDSLKKLQQKALENLRERETFQATGIASLKVRLPVGNTINISIKLTEKGRELKHLVAETLEVTSDRLKIIGMGKIIADDTPMEDQGVKHGMHLMALLLRGSIKELHKFEANDALLKSTKRDVGLLSARDDDSYFQITDQSGKALTLPPAERKALVLAMTLHEKAKTAIKDENYSTALFLLLEAEKEFSVCNSKLLEQVDNYGLLNLDIAWCYLCLQSLNLLPDAQSRLLKCEQVFQKTYGANLERLMSIKGSTVSEGALYLRLHLLQGIVCYHQNQFDLARASFKQVEDELKGLKVDDETLSQLLELGYSLAESRVALRESKGNINIAVSIIENKRAEREKNEIEARKERDRNRERMKLGKCKNGTWVEPEFHKSLVAMGYSHSTAAWALAQASNNIGNAISLIQEHPERIPLEVLPMPDESTVKQLISLGFDAISATTALQQHAGDIDKALDELVKVANQLNETLPSTSLESQPSTSTAGTSQLNSGNTEAKKLKRALKDMKEQNNAYSRVAEGISNAADDYLDLALTTEEQFLTKYKSLLDEQNRGE